MSKHALLNGEPAGATLLSTVDLTYDYLTTAMPRDQEGELRSPGPNYRLAHVVPIATSDGSGRLMLFWERALPNDPPDPGKVAGPTTP